MKREVNAAVNYLQRMVEARSNLDPATVQLFAHKLEKLMLDKYKGHWFPDCPSRGQAYRCISITDGAVCDDVLLKACQEYDIPPSELCLPPEFTMWIDPLEVCARTKERHRTYTIARFKKESSSGPSTTTAHTSDYYSSSSSGCSSTSSSDDEEEETCGELGPAAIEADMVAMVPRVQKGCRANRTKCVRNTLPQYHYSPACNLYKTATPAYVLMCPAPPPPPQPLFGFYVLPPQRPQFVMPKAPLHTWRLL